MKSDFKKTVSLEIGLSLLILFVLPFNNNSFATEPPVDSSQQIAEKIVASSLPVLVDFWAVWCQPCRILDPIIEELEEEYRDRVLFIKVDSDIHRGIASYFGVKAIPTIYLVNDKTVVSAIQGVRTKEYYMNELDRLLEKIESQDNETP